MLHPVFSTLIKRPDLVVDHLSAYVELVQQETSHAGADWVQRALAWALTACGALVFVILAGVALMLGALNAFHWALLAVPGAALLVTALAWSRTKAPPQAERFTELKSQLDSDVRALREAAR